MAHMVAYHDLLVLRGGEPIEWLTEERLDAYCRDIAGMTADQIRGGIEKKVGAMDPARRIATEKAAEFMYDAEHGFGAWNDAEAATREGEALKYMLKSMGATVAPRKSEAEVVEEKPKTLAEQESELRKNFAGAIDSYRDFLEKAGGREKAVAQLDMIDVMMGRRQPQQWSQASDRNDSRNGRAGRASGGIEM